jgi:hypothetical protein
MKGIDSTGAHFVHVPGWMGGSKSGFKDCLQQSKIRLSGAHLVLAICHSPNLLFFFWCKCNFYCKNKIG